MIADLNEKFAIEGVAHIVAGNGGLPAVVVTSPAAHGALSLHGGQVTSWTPSAAGADALFVSRQAVWQRDRAIRGGIPVCFPWFGAHPTNPGAPSHGFARLREWQLASIEQHGDGVVVTVDLSSDAASRELWPHDFHLRLRVAFGAALQVDLTVTNCGRGTFSFEEALHTYFAVADIRSTSLSGLDGARYLDTVGGIREARQQGDVRFEAETDRIYFATGEAIIHDASRPRRIRVRKKNSANTVVWNPWIARAKAFADFGDDEWTGMLCVETCNVGEAAVVLEAGRSHTMTVAVTLND
ncbi:MAG: D-hexose-6-phosphate mutarotase [Vicinamibacterales bacterium]